MFLVALVREFGWSRSLVAGAFSLFTLIHGLASFPIGWLSDRIGPRRLVLSGGVVLTLGLVLDGAVTRPWQLYLAYGVVTAAGVSMAGWVPAVMLVQRWYPQRVGTMLGLTSAGIGVGISFFGPFSQWLIDLVGWRGAFRIVAAIAFSWIVPATLLLVRESPRTAVAPATARVPAGDDPTLRGVLPTLRFWLLGTCSLSTSFVNQTLLVHQVAYLVDHGISTFMAATVVSIVGIGSTVSKGAGGWVSDTLGREATYTLGMALVLASVGSLGLLAVVPSPAWAYLYGLLIGLGYSVTAPLMPAVVSDFYRGRHFGAIFGAIQAVNALGGSAGPWVAGRIFDHTGSYAGALMLTVAAGVLSIAALWLAAPRRERAFGA